MIKKIKALLKRRKVQQTTSTQDAPSNRRDSCDPASVSAVLTTAVLTSDYGSCSHSHHSGSFDGGGGFDGGGHSGGDCGGGGF